MFKGKFKWKKGGCPHTHTYIHHYNHHHSQTYRDLGLQQRRQVWYIYFCSLSFLASHPQKFFPVECFCVQPTNPLIPWSSSETWFFEASKRLSTHHGRRRPSSTHHGRRCRPRSQPYPRVPVRRGAEQCAHVRRHSAGAAWASGHGICRADVVAVFSRVPDAGGRLHLRGGICKKCIFSFETSLHHSFTLLPRREVY